MTGKYDIRVLTVCYDESGTHSVRMKVFRKSRGKSENETSC